MRATCSRPRSSRRPDQFVATFLFHHFLGESDLAWLRQLTAERLSDEEARALVFVREAGAIDNAAYRAVNRTDTLQASMHLRRLRDLGVLEMKGSGSRTYYVPGPRMTADSLARDAKTHKAGAETHKADAETHMLTTGTHLLGAEPGHASAPIPPALATRIKQAGKRPKRDLLEALILDLCAWRPLAARELGQLLGDRDVRDLTRTYLRPMVAAGPSLTPSRICPNTQARSTLARPGNPHDRPPHPTAA